jgi:hypothetical protein
MALYKPKSLLFGRQIDFVILTRAARRRISIEFQSKRDFSLRSE